MNVSIIGGGAWGTTLAQVLSDNGHLSLIRDINQTFVDKINNEHLHPFFNLEIPHNISATADLAQALNFSDIIVLCVPTKAMRAVLVDINAICLSKKLFINVSKGIEPD